MRKILLISNMFPSLKYPHYGVFVSNSVEMLRNSGYKVTICGIRKIDSKLIRLFEYGRIYIKCIICGIFGNYSCLYAHYVSHTAIPVKIVKKFHPSIILVENAHGGDVMIQTPSNRINITRSRKVLPLADAVIVPSEYFKKHLIDEYALPQEKIFISPSGGINSGVFYPKSKLNSRMECELELQSWYVGLIGRITAGKGWNTFLQAAHEVWLTGSIPNLRILVVGGGDEEFLLREQVKLLELEKITTIRSFCTQEKLCDYYNSLNCFVFPSETESLGLVGLEAMACGTFCLFSDIPAIKTYGVKDRNCLIFENKNVKQIVQCILQAYSLNDESKSKIVNEALKTVMGYDLNTIRKEFVKIFDRLIIQHETGNKKV